jgi:hypothetical protein
VYKLHLVGYVYLETEVGEEFAVVGISSSEQTYRIAWMLNLAFHWQLSKMCDIECSQRFGMSYHDCYTYQSDDGALVIYLIDNRTPEGTLIQEMASFDYLLKIMDGNEVLEDVFYNKLRRLPLIMAIMQMDIVKLQKSAHYRYLEVLG